ncbi:hypothetical protein [Alkalihalobacillus sp. R86527]|uniref:hypothetical protein n=1 Tax=Alkalihalobacillus sp. R86527 TaxID=3093863 RepID=UPI0036706220
MRKLVGGLTFALCLSLGFPQLGFASDGSNEELEHSDVGSIVQFEGVTDIVTPEQPSEPDMIYPDILNPDEPSCVACGVPSQKVSTISGPNLVSTKFVRYLSGSWSYASRYTWTKSNTASATVTSDAGLSAGGISSKLGVSSSVTTSYSVAATIPADSKRLSKLAFYSDYNKRYVKVSTYISGKLYSSKNTYHYAPRKDTYLLAAYK